APVSKRFSLVTISIAGVIAGCGPGSAKSSAKKPASPASSSSFVAVRTSGHPGTVRFANRVDNPWFPLTPGTTLVYRGVRDGMPSQDVFTVTHATKTIDGVRCVVVKDSLYLFGKLAERTTDWYTQDTVGNVWFFGEQTAELE